VRIELKSLWIANSGEGRAVTEGVRMNVPEPMLRVATLLLLLLAGTPATAQTPPTLASRGQAILTGACAVCHAVGGTTGGPAYMAPSFAEIALRTDLGVLRESLQKNTVAGHPAMPKTSLSPIDIEAILTYLEAMGAR
jgi:mono/diheme cytochrome c family protein